MKQLRLTWTSTDGPSKEIDLDVMKRCQSNLIVEIIDRLIDMGYHIDAVIPVLYKRGIALEMANIIISKTAPQQS